MVTQIRITFAEPLPRVAVEKTHAAIVEKEGLAGTAQIRLPGRTVEIGAEAQEAESVQQLTFVADTEHAVDGIAYCFAFAQEVEIRGAEVNVT